MSMFWVRDVMRLYVRYLLLGACAIPAAVMYAVLRTENFDSWRYVGPLLILGLASAYAGWLLSSRLLALDSRPSPAGALSSAFSGLGMRAASVAVVANTNLTSLGVDQPWPQNNLRGIDMQVLAGAI